MKIDVISDLHGFQPDLPGGDLLIVGGDWTRRDTYQENILFKNWLDEQDYARKVFIAGNHDNLIQNTNLLNDVFYEYFDDYLCDSGTEFEGLKIWGTPWTAYFNGMNPHCAAFTINVGCDTDQWLAEKWAMIPDDIDILITHSPPYGILDESARGEKCGSPSLLDRIRIVSPEMVIFGHIHEKGGKYVQEKGILYVNGSIVNEEYRVVNNGRRINFDEKMPEMQRFKVIE